MTRDRSLDVAVTGVAVRMPACSTLEEWWSALVAGRVLTTRYERDTLIDAGVPAALVDDPDYVPVRGHLFDADRFDGALFQVSRREAELMDPQHRLMLETVWAALEDASVSPLDEAIPTAVFASASGSDYQRSILAGGALDPATLDDVVHGTEPDFIAGRIAYKLGLSGPAMAVQTACSSSLVSVHLAVQALVNGDCDQAVVVGAGIGFPQAGHLHLPGGILSARGRCRPFDEMADGVVVGSGVACVVLRRLADALEDGPELYGVLLGSAINNDGASKAGFFAPSGVGQQAVIRAALNAADVGANSIGYLETHGTGTAIGDPIEWTAANAALSSAGASPGQVAIGALKANVGHLDAAAGVAALIKTLLVVRHGLVPPVAGFQHANKLLDADGAVLFVPTGASPWSGPQPRRAGVSAFGIGGTNAHVIVEQAPPLLNALGDDRRPGAHLITLSAGDVHALARSAWRLAQHLRIADPDLAQVASLLVTGRAELRERLAVSGRDCAEVAAKLSDAAQNLRQRDQAAKPGPLVLAFPGQGVQYPGMAIPLTKALPGFDTVLDRSVSALAAVDPKTADLVRRALCEVDFPAEELTATELAQPALFALGYSAAVALTALGPAPVAVVGHSVGEIAAACYAGVLDLAVAARFVLARGRAMQACPSGAMLALGCDSQSARALLAASGAALELAADNSPASAVLAGTEAEVERFELWLGGRVSARRLRTSHAFHTALMLQAIPELAAALQPHQMRSPVVPLAVNLTGELIPVLAPVGPELFVNQVRRTVRYRESIEALADRFPGFTIIEVGPGRTLSAMAEASGYSSIALNPARTARPEVEVLDAVGSLWELGHPLSRNFGVQRTDGRRIRLPGYSFAGPRHIAREAVSRDTEPPGPGCVQPAKPSIGPATPSTSCIAARPASGSLTEADTLLRELWAELLGLDELHGDPDFFQLGGDSLLIIRLARRLKAELGISVPVRDMLAVRTLGRQAAIVRSLVDNLEAADSESIP